MNAKEYSDLVKSAIVAGETIDPDELEEFADAARAKREATHRSQSPLCECLACERRRGQ